MEAPALGPTDIGVTLGGSSGARALSPWVHVPGGSGPKGSLQCCCQHPEGHTCPGKGGHPSTHHRHGATVPEEQQPQCQVLQLPHPAPGASMCSSTHPWGLFPGSLPHPCLVFPQGSMGQRCPGSRGADGCPRGAGPPGAGGDEAESLARSLSNCGVAPPGSPMCQVIHAPTHVCAHEQAHAAHRDLPHGSTGTDPAGPAPVGFGSTQSLQMKPGGRH